MDKELEEAAERHYINCIPSDRYSFIAGAKWQEKRMYSEEDLNKMFDTLQRNSVDNVATITNVDLFINSWKREFKKK